MKHFMQYLARAMVFAFGLASNAAGADFQSEPRIPPELQVPPRHTLQFRTRAAGTQNYMCVSGETGPAWRFAGPHATLFVPMPWSRGEAVLQLMTHFLSPNPAEGGTPRPAWQSSHDSGMVWGKAIASSSDPRYVAPESIPWLLVQVTGARRGPAGGGMPQTAYIQRVNTSGGLAPAGGCDAGNYGQMVLAPYTTDYLFYQPDGRK
jgi:hypothetical protein